MCLNTDCQGCVTRTVEGWVGGKGVEAEDQKRKDSCLSASMFYVKTGKCERRTWNLTSPASLLTTQREATKTAPTKPG